MTTATELLPCPFCGARADAGVYPFAVSYQIRCSNLDGCAVRPYIDKPDEEAASQAWNRRAIAAPADSDIERLREAIQYALPVAEEEWADEQCSRMGVTTVGLAAIRKMREALRPSVAAPADSAPQGALETFTAYFVANYPGPNTIIHDPKWHAPKIFRAAEFAISSVAAPRAPAPPPADSAPVATPTNIKQQIFEAAVVAHGVRFAVQKLPRPDVPSLEAIWVGVDEALAAPPRAPAPDAPSADTMNRITRGIEQYAAHHPSTASTETLREWMRKNMTFYNTAERNKPVRASVAQRIWYHATDDMESYPFDSVIDAALSGDQGAKI